MRILFTLSLLLTSLISHAQLKYSLDDNLTGIYGSAKNGEQLSLVANGNNRLELKNFYLDVKPFSSVKYSGSNMTENDFLIRQDVGYKANNLTLFVVYQYNYSYLRGIKSDHWFGSGVGRKFEINDHFYVGLSYAALYEYRRYYEQAVETIIRNSFRVKVGLKSKSTQLLLEYYVQPNINNQKDVNMFGSAQLVLFADRFINFVVQNTLNYQSTDKIEMIQSTTVGFKLKLVSKEEKNKK